ncbi:MAG: hypothetical protein Q8P61_02080 [Candidatus Nanopelagicales bacterium]|nr:hypothetical protein [Candidatus Nanopelagicales bacterium]
MDEVKTLAERKLARAANGAGPKRYPFCALAGQRTYQLTSARAWTSGFFPAELWLMYQQTGDGAWLSRARRSTAGLIGVAGWSGTHDLGFMVGLPVGLAAELDPSPRRRAKYRAAYRKAAVSLSRRWNGRVGAIKSDEFGGKWGLIVDSAMNAPLLIDAGQSIGGRRGQKLQDRGTRHMRTLARYFVRGDGSTAHRLVFNRRTGKLIGSTPGQGFSGSSTWSRGQAWAIYGFAQAFTLTRDPQLLATAMKLADYWLRHVPAGCVPAWDFDARGKHPIPDSSAASIAAAGLLRLSGVASDPARADAYRRTAVATLDALTSSKWTPRQSTNPGILQGQSWDVPAIPREGSYVWGDAYLLNALWREMKNPR